MEDSVKEALCAVFATCHRSTSDKSVEMLNKLKRKNYVTPTNFLEFVNGQGLTLVHFSAQRKRFVRDWGCIQGFRRSQGCLWCIVCQKRLMLS
jgi:hypothetical protein